MQRKHLDWPRYTNENAQKMSEMCGATLAQVYSEPSSNRNRGTE